MTTLITPQTLTDERVREEWALALDSGDRDMVHQTALALGFWRGSTEHLADDQAATEAHEARVRICDAINRRNALREDGPCPGNACKHSYDDWPADSVIRADRAYDQCSECGWTEAEVNARAKESK